MCPYTSVRLSLVGVWVMAEIRALGDIVDKWTTVTPQRTADYEKGVKSPRADWEASTVAANAAWKEGVSKASTADRFATGVKKAGSAAWSKGAQTKGVQRWGPGVQLAGGKYGDGFAPYHQAIGGLTLPVRFARGDARNYQRVEAVGKALRAVKEKQG